MKNLVAKAGLTVLGSTLLLATAGAKSASALFIKATETFTVSEDVSYQNLNTGNFDRQFRSHNGDGPLFGRYTPEDSDMDILESYAFNAGGDVRNMAAVGSFTSEQMRGLVEFNLSAYYSMFAKLQAQVTSGELEQVEADIIKAKLIASAAMNFKVFQLGGLHPDNQNPLGTGDNDGNIRVAFYEGNGQEDLADYGDGYSKKNDEAITGTPSEYIGEEISFGPFTFFDYFVFSTNGMKKGQKVSISIAQAVEVALDNGWDYLGLRLESERASSDTDPLGGCAYDSRNPNNPAFDKCSAISFSDFTIGAVPTPAAILPSILGMAMGAIRKRRNQTDEEVAAES